MRRPLVSDKAYAALLAASQTHVASLAGLSLYDHRCDMRVVKSLVSRGYVYLHTTPLQSQYYRLLPAGKVVFEVAREERKDRKVEAGR